MQLCLLIGSENFTFSKEHFLSQPNCCWRNKKHRLEKKIKKSLSIGVNVNSLLLFRCKVNVFYKQLQLFSHSKCPLSRGLSWCLLILLISRWQQEKYSFHFSGLGSAKFGKAMYNIHKSVRCCVLRSHKERTLCTFRELAQDSLCLLPCGQKFWWCQAVSVFMQSFPENCPMPIARGLTIALFL